MKPNAPDANAWLLLDENLSSGEFGIANPEQRQHAPQFAPATPVLGWQGHPHAAIRVGEPGQYADGQATTSSPFFCTKCSSFRAVPAGRF